MDADGSIPKASLIFLLLVFALSVPLTASDSFGATLDVVEDDDFSRDRRSSSHADEARPPLASPIDLPSFGRPVFDGADASASAPEDERDAARSGAARNSDETESSAVYEPRDGPADDGDAANGARGREPLKVCCSFEDASPAPSASAANATGEGPTSNGATPDGGDAAAGNATGGAPAADDASAAGSESASDPGGAEDSAAAGAAGGDDDDDAGGGGASTGDGSSVGDGAVDESEPRSFLRDFLHSLLARDGDGVPDERDALRFTLRLRAFGASAAAEGSF